MSRTTARLLAVILPLGAFLTDGLAQSTLPTITVTVYNRSHMRVQTLTESEQMAGRILRKAGLATLWVDCSANGRNGISEQCRKLPGGTRLVLTIVNTWPSRSPAEASRLGLALQTASGAGSYCYVFQQQLNDLVRDTHVAAARLLGAAMAHEIGHLLEGSDSHSGFGIMAANWYIDQIQAADRGALGFTTTDVAKIRARLSAGALASHAR